MRVLQYLEETPSPERRVSQEAIAELLAISPRTIYNWRRQTPRAIGRPRHSNEAHRLALWKVGRELRKQGYPGWRAVKAGLQGQVPDRLIQEYVSKFKFKRRRRLTLEREAKRKHTEVLKPNVIWSLDSAHMSRGVEAQVVRDRCSRKVVELVTGPPARGASVLELLKRLKDERGTLPLVLSTDNGAAFVSDEVKVYLEQEQVIHLRSLPRTPQHNSSVEIAIRELREASENRLERLEAAKNRLNQHRLRACLGYKAADSIDDGQSGRYNQEREAFFRNCCMRIAEAVQGSTTSRERRMREREAIHASLEHWGWIKQWRGGRPILTTRPERDS